MLLGRNRNSSSLKLAPQRPSWRQRWPCGLRRFPGRLREVGKYMLSEGDAGLLAKMGRCVREHYLEN